MKACIEMIRKLASASTSGLMAENMKVGGIMGNNMDLESIRIQVKARLNMDYGNMERESPGLIPRQYTRLMITNINMKLNLKKLKVKI